ncbi:hypothetical protein BDN72DRAFT_381935 [Pluteus cervinus]|uniref:Uncharacterized protein n=1 Tax=Pluteus cervinus TaxID=181527 RepID=A0ACD3AB51_9AGAR|nr:hypothetical protein BDN72DRAFT_381935 [Pluteus cervinus]
MNISPETQRIVVGPWYIGLILNYFLFGALVIQLYDYFSNYHATDRRSVKGVAYFLFVAEIVQTVLVTRATWEVVIEGWGSTQPFAQVPESAACIPAVNAFLSCIAQLFFAWRIFMLTKTTFWRSVAGVIATISLTQFAAGLAVTVRYFAIDRLPQRWSELHDVVGVWMGATIICDLTIAIAMLSMFSKAREDPQFLVAEGFVNKIIINGFETGAVSATIAVLTLAFFFRFQDNFLHIVPLVLLGRIYSNVLLCSLNGRRRAGQMGMTPPGSNTSYSFSEPSSGGGALHQGFSKASQFTSIQIGHGMSTTDRVNSKATDAEKSRPDPDL